MKSKQFLKALIAGLAFPALCLPILYAGLALLHPESYSKFTEFQYIPMFVPLYFGIANIIYVYISNKVTVNRRDNVLIAVGLVLGFVIATLNIPTFIFGVFPGTQGAYIILPVLYALIFRFIVKAFNELLGVNR